MENYSSGPVTVLLEPDFVTHYSVAEKLSIQQILSVWKNQRVGYMPQATIGKVRVEVDARLGPVTNAVSKFPEIQVLGVYFECIFAKLMS